MTDEAPEEDVKPASTVATRWFMPALVIWAGVLLSAWVYTNKIPAELREHGGSRLLVTLGATPAASVVTLVLLRFVAGRKNAYSRVGDVMILWVMAFLFVVHASVLAVAIGMIGSLDSAIPAATGLLLFGMGPVLHGLEPGSAMGIRTAATLGDDDVWRRTHAFAGKSFGIAGVIALVGLWFEGPILIIVAVGPGILALLISVIYAGRIAPAND